MRQQSLKKIKKKVKIQRTETVQTIPEETEVYNTIRYIVVPPDGGWGWVVVAASFFSSFVVDGVMYTFGIFLVDISETFKCHPSEITLANSICTGLYYILGPLVCAMTNRLGFRTVGILGGILAVVSFTLSSFATVKIWYILSHALLGGVAFSMCYIPSILAVGFYFDKWRAIATAIAVCGSSVGVIALPPIFNIALKNYDWRFKYKALAGLTVLLAICGIIYKPILPVKLITEDKQTGSLKADDKYSLTSVSIDGENLKSIFYKKHNTQFPTNADLVGKASYITQPVTEKSSYYQKSNDPNTSTSRSSFKSYKSLVLRTSWGTLHSEKMNMNVIYEDEDKETCRCLPCKCTNYARYHFSCVCSTVAPSRPMYRDDIFFTGSVATLSKYSKATIELQKKKPTLEQAIDYNLSVTRITTKLDLEQDKKCCLCCPEAVARTLATMLDFNLLKSWPFVLLVTSGFFTFLGVYIPYIYLSESCVAHGMNEQLATYLLSVIGISNTIGRISCGIMTFLPRLSVLSLTIVGLLISGGGTVISVFYPSKYIVQFSYAVVYGLFTACVPALRSIIAVEMVGLDKLTNAFGLIVMFEGAACVIGAPISSILKEKTNSYRAPLLFAGINILFSAVLLMPIPKLVLWETNKVLRREMLERQRKDKQQKEAIARANATIVEKQRTERIRKK